MFSTHSQIRARYRKGCAHNQARQPSNPFSCAAPYVPPSRFLHWRFAYAGPGVRRATVMGPASANLHNSGSGDYSQSPRRQAKSSLK